MSFERRAWLACVVAGVLVLLLSALLFPVFPQEGAGYASGYGAPVYAFEMASSIEDLHLVFGAPGDPERPARIAAMDLGNQLDYLFLLAYGSFVGLFFVAARHSTGRGGWLAFAVFGPLAAVADAAENVLLLDVTANLEAAEHLALLPYPVWAKFLSLMVAGVGAGVFLMTRERWVWRALGAVAALGALTVALSFYAPSRFGSLSGAGIGLAWFVQLVFAIAGYVVAKRREAAGTPPRRDAIPDTP